MIKHIVSVFIVMFNIMSPKDADVDTNVIEITAICNMNKLTQFHKHNLKVTYDKYASFLLIIIVAGCESVDLLVEVVQNLSQQILGHLPKVCPSEVQQFPDCLMPSLRIAGLEPRDELQHLGARHRAKTD